MTEIPEEVLRAYALEGGTARGEHGLINRTFVVEREGRRVVVQRLHPVFGAAVHLDIEAITQHLEGRGHVTPRLCRTSTGALWLEHAGEVWRAMSYVEGVSHQRITDPALAGAAGAGVARFHHALADLRHDFFFARAGVHDTAAHLAALRTALASEAGRAVPEARELGDAILAAAASLPLASFDALPKRITHGDLKISNLRFAPGGEPRVVCLIDLDTLGLQAMAYELGDAFRSWCNPHTEDELRPRFDAALFEAALRGYAQQAPGFMTDAERASLVPGTYAVCVELASRFCRDAIEDRYFGWDPVRFPSRRAHNLARARSQLTLALSVDTQRAELERIVHALWPR